MNANDFFRLNILENADSSNAFFLDTNSLEKKMEKYTGEISLSSSDFTNLTNEFLLQQVPFFDNRDPDKIKKITDKYLNIKSPCSMSVDSFDELFKHAEEIYKISYFNYILGKKNYLGFPYYRCEKSSKNVVLSSIDAGYPNAAYTIGKIADHAYVLFPFVMEKDNIKGSLIVDPTYDQLQFSNGLRNAMFIRLGSSWDYFDPVRGSDLTPGIVCSIDSIRKSNFNSIEGYHNGKEFFEKAFSNPVHITKN